MQMGSDDNLTGGEKSLRDFFYMEYRKAPEG